MKEYTRKRIVYGAGLVALLVACIGYFLPSNFHDGPSHRQITLARAKQLWVGIAVYKDDFGNYPAGDNATIMKLLCGGNPKNRQLFPFGSRYTHRATNQLGQCVDAWDTPFQIDVSVTSPPLILSAGANRIFRDKDDLAFDGSNNTFAKP